MMSLAFGNLQMKGFTMPHTKHRIDTCHGVDLRKLAACAILLTMCFPLRSMAQQPGQKVFSSPEEATKALVMAMQSNDEKATLELLGSDGKQIVSSGDETEDARTRANFVHAYREMHRLVNEPDGTTILYIGAKNWPTPIPLVHKGQAWYFDTDAGKKEILYRRIGRNEISTIRVCQELVAAEKDYRRTQPEEYAQKILSDAGRRNGLYWPAAAGNPQSPIGPLVASAVAEGYTNGKEIVQTPYRGYYFHILTQQGKHAPGGAKSYIVNGKMTEGFGFVAYPAEYRSSGVMTFIVGSDGVVYQKDLGKETPVVAKAMKEYDPDASWNKAEEAQAETAREQKTE
jgi:Protein of unknown function (DUF2950)